jgi:hypothetical protein
MVQDDSRKYKRNDELSVENSGATCYVLVNPGSWVVLEGSARALWEEIEINRTLTEIVDRLLAKYSGDTTAIATDTWETLREWVALGLAIETSQGSKA